MGRPQLAGGEAVRDRFGEDSPQEIRSRVLTPRPARSKLKRCFDDLRNPVTAAGIRAATVVYSGYGDAEFAVARRCAAVSLRTKKMESFSSALLATTGD